MWREVIRFCRHSGGKEYFFSFPFLRKADCHSQWLNWKSLESWKLDYCVFSYGWVLRVWKLQQGSATTQIPLTEEQSFGLFSLAKCADIGGMHIEW